MNMAFLTLLLGEFHKKSRFYWKISFATVTDGCIEPNLIGYSHFSQFFLESFTKNEDFIEIFHKITLFCNHQSWLPKGQFLFSFFKVDSQNPKFILEYLICLPLGWICWQKQLGGIPLFWVLVQVCSGRAHFKAMNQLQTWKSIQIRG